MSAREELRNGLLELVDHGGDAIYRTFEAVEAVLDAYRDEVLREAAEKIRALLSDNPDADLHDFTWNDVVDQCAEEIDPDIP